MSFFKEYRFSGLGTQGCTTASKRHLDKDVIISIAAIAESARINVYVCEGGHWGSAGTQAMLVIQVMGRNSR